MIDHARARALIVVVAAALAGCTGGGSAPGADAGGQAQPGPAVERAVPEPHPLPPDPEEQRRRSEAVRRAAEELALRGVDTRQLLINLIVEDDSYRVAFVEHAGGRLDTRHTVRVRRQDFEILSIEPDAGPR